MIHPLFVAGFLREEGWNPHGEPWPDVQEWDRCGSEEVIQQPLQPEDPDYDMHLSSLVSTLARIDGHTDSEVHSQIGAFAAIGVSTQYKGIQDILVWKSPHGDGYGATLYNDNIKDKIYADAMSPEEALETLFARVERWRTRLTPKKQSLKQEEIPPLGGLVKAVGTLSLVLAFEKATNFVAKVRKEYE